MLRDAVFKLGLDLRLPSVLVERRRLNHENIGTESTVDLLRDDDDRSGLRAFVYFEKLDLVCKVFNQVDLFDRDLPQMRWVQLAWRLCKEGVVLVVAFGLDTILLDRLTIRLSDGRLYTVDAGDAVKAGCGAIAR